MQGISEPSSLAALRTREDAMRATLERVRARLVQCTEMTRELRELESRSATERGGAYRSDARALDERLELVRRARDERAHLRVAEAELMTQLEALRARLERRGIRHISLPMLENVAIASPCHVSWAEMEGDSDTRFCGSCEKHVHNLSMMSREEAEAVVSAAGANTCVRFYRRDDGTMLTQDCPVGARRRRFWRRTSGIATAGILLAALGAVAYSQLVCKAHVPVQVASQGGLS